MSLSAPTYCPQYVDGDSCVPLVQVTAAYNNPDTDNLYYLVSVRRQDVAAMGGVQVQYGVVIDDYSHRSP